MSPRCEHTVLGQKGNKNDSSFLALRKKTYPSRIMSSLYNRLNFVATNMIAASAGPAFGCDGSLLPAGRASAEALLCWLIELRSALWLAPGSRVW